jgi:predicted nuclease with TOPRIM domain
MSSAPPLADLLGWVREGAHLFGAALQTLQHSELLQERAERLEQENRRLGEEMRIIRAELERLRTDRVEAAESLKAIAEHVTRLATVALQRLSKPVA